MNDKEIKMKVFINGQSITVEEKQPTILIALQQYLTADQQKQSFAIALNGDFVGRTEYQQTSVNQNDSIDILFPIQGG